VDANGGYTTGQAVRVADELSAIGVTWFEEPVSSQDLAGLAVVRAQVRPDVAAGEYSWSLADSARLIDAGACTRMWGPRSLTCGTWSTSTITSE
jgi:L-alanine-DL-glutamate epimerase-like enolase superfamily enzyme